MNTGMSEGRVILFLLAAILFAAGFIIGHGTEPFILSDIDGVLEKSTSIEANGGYQRVAGLSLHLVQD